MKTIFRLENGSQVSLQMIGEGDNALVAKTPYTNCCVPPFRMGEWYFPNGTRIGPPRDGQSFFRNRGNMVVRLNRRVTDVDDSIVYPTGWYRCELPDGCGDLTSIYIELGMCGLYCMCVIQEHCYIYAEFELIHEQTIK